MDDGVQDGSSLETSMSISRSPMHMHVTPSNFKHPLVLEGILQCLASAEHLVFKLYPWQNRNPREPHRCNPTFEVSRRSVADWLPPGRATGPEACTCILPFEDQSQGLDRSQTSLGPRNHPWARPSGSAQIAPFDIDRLRRVCLADWSNPHPVLQSEHRLLPRRLHTGNSTHARSFETNRLNVVLTYERIIQDRVSTRERATEVVHIRIYKGKQP
ncbi:hypothetical protein BKA93DRAFT_47408 [Sparassis latifolia]